ncbi:ArsR/SmtB family transcription factor [Geomesophilobacter sediminis]|uniref:Metalloregulator ArsR/SmtB family transcription factor n=1 Tax=Geomesophilobacter sediminis TaxID=2798584 RepID=A0A8J7SAZ1_9BACT|nr:metalloregulator ArsR/SmtB family transcription factor [Geomesophilobacter sediminis]MBJ6727765.1 metalloregulator ArsR/SmtB family transcription factor [Geomesophilobacter sediminis]
METVAQIFRSLEDETRLRIMALLLEQEELCVCDVMAVLQMPQSTVSRQLSLLKKAGWLKDRRVGVWIHYSVSRTLSPMHQYLLPVLRNFLAVTDAARLDRERLAERRKSCCP